VRGCGFCAGTTDGYTLRLIRPCQAVVPCLGSVGVWWAFECELGLPEVANGTLALCMPVGNGGGDFSS